MPEFRLAKEVKSAGDCHYSNTRLANASSNRCFVAPVLATVFATTKQHHSIHYNVVPLVNEYAKRRVAQSSRLTTAPIGTTPALAHPYGAIA
ncbi:MAG: hypothetical protein JNL84_04835 [Candidatus Accumulibacter sp.]|nr:hypothetical protein [Accumulibacter sp.]